MNAAEPAKIELGVNAEIAGPEAVTVKVTALDVVLVSGLCTVIENVPAVVKLLAGIVAVNWVELTKVVAMLELAH